MSTDEMKRSEAKRHKAVKDGALSASATLQLRGTMLARALMPAEAASPRTPAPALQLAGPRLHMRVQITEF